MRIPKIFFISLMLLVLSIFMLSCSKDQPEKPSDLFSRITETKVLKVGTDFVGTPFAFYQDGKEIGFEVDLIQEVARELGVQIEWVKIPFGVNNFTESLGRDKVDLVIESVSLTSDRKEKFLFTHPYFISGQAVVVRQTENVPDQFDISLLKDKKIGVQSGTTGEFFAKNNTSAQIFSFESSEKQLNALINGEVDAIISDILNTQTTAWPMWKKIKVVLKNLTHEEYCIVAQKDQQILVQKINDILQKFKDDPIDGIYAKLYRKWFY